MRRQAIMLACAFAWKTVIFFMLHALCNQISYDLITGQHTSPIDLLTKRRQAEIHAGAASVEQDAGHGEFSCSLLLMEFCQIVLRQLTQAVGQKYNVGVFKAGVHELDRLIQGTLKICAAVEECLGGIHLILHGILPRQKNVHLARGRTGKMNEREFAPVFCGNIQQRQRHSLTPRSSVSAREPDSSRQQMISPMPLWMGSRLRYCLSRRC